MDEEQLFNSGNKNNEQIPSQNISSQNPNTVRNINYNTNYNTNYEKGDKKKGCLIGGLIALAIFITVNTLIIFGTIGAVFSSSPEEEAYTYGNYVETIKIEGTIASDNANSYGIPVGYQHQWTLDKVKSLMEDENNKGILLYINSGGGGTYESDELYLALKEYKEKTNRPIYAYYAQTAASGAVYISMAADEIYANRMTLTGSIGVKVTNYNVSELMNKLGIKETTVTSGANKNMFSSTSPETPEQIQIIQKMIDETYEIFIQIVSEERNIPLDEVKKIADGRIYTPVQAMDLKLIDGIYTYEDFMNYVKEKPEFADCEFITNEYTDTSFWGSFFSKLPEKPKSQVDLLTDILKKSESYQLLY